MPNTSDFFQAGISDLQIVLNSKFDKSSLLIDLSGKRHTRSQTAPINPSTGDTWEELDTNDQYLMYWFWNGTYWLSNEVLWKEASLTNLGGATTVHYELSSFHNIYVLNFKTNFLLGPAANATNYWSFVLNRVGTSTVAISTPILLNAGVVNTWSTINQAINLHINIGTTGSKAFRLDLTRTGNPSNLTGSVSILYRLARV